MKPESKSEVTRREALVGSAAGLAALSMNSAALGASREAAQDSAAGPKPADYVAKDFSGIVGMPGFSKPLLEAHFTLYHGYVKNVNAAAAELAAHAADASAPPAAEVRRRFGWEFNGMRLHELYFENLGGKAPPDKASKAAAKITASFGSLDNWSKEFRLVGGMRGIGWAALVHDPWSGRLFNTWINEHDVGVLAGCPLLLIMDVFEHAYMTDYGIKKAGYIDAFMKNINWEAVEKRMI